MFNNLWAFIVTVVLALPWLAIAIAAGMAFGKHGKSPAAGLQALGAIGVFLVALLQFLANWIFNISHAPYDVIRTITTILSFLQFVALVLFAAGFCWEKFAQWRAKPAPAVPAMPLK